jgi:multimeric flavodoxin WrbA
MKAMKHVTIVSASPKVGEPSVSGWLASHACDILQNDILDVNIISVRECISKKQTADAYASMADADALIIIFPLYIFCMPGLLTRFLQDYDVYLKSLPIAAKKPLIYTVVNCGFPEPEINEEAVRVIGSFSKKIGAEFRFGVMIGGGGMIIGAQGSPMVRQMMAEIDGALTRIKREVESGCPEPSENVLARIRFPRRLYFLMAGIGWKTSARKNGLRKKDLYARPYTN